MSHFCTRHITLRALQVIALGRAFARQRNRRRRAIARHYAAFYEHAWRSAADELGASFTALGDGIADIAVDGAMTRVSGSFCAIDDPTTLELAGNKPLTYSLLHKAGIPVPPHVRFSLSDIAPADAFRRGSDADCVVKPARGTGGGRGVTTGVQTRWHLAKAAAAAAVYGDDLLIEREVPGDNYRLLYLDGELIDAFVRHPPTVTGDGRSTIRRLVERANAQRASSGSAVSQVLIAVDLEMRRTLARQGLSLHSAPETGRVVQLKTVINENTGADNVTAMDSLCRSIVAEGEKAVAVLRTRFAGVDVITRDPGVPLAETGGVVLEVNTTPGLYYHYHKRDGSFPAAVHVLRRLLTHGQRMEMAEVGALA